MRKFNFQLVGKNMLIKKHTNQLIQELIDTI